DDDLSFLLTVDGEYGDSLFISADQSNAETPEARLNAALQKAVIGTSYGDLADLMRFAMTVEGENAYLWIKWNEDAKPQAGRAFRMLEINGGQSLGYEPNTVITVEHAPFEPLSLQSLVRAVNGVIPNAKLRFSTK